MLLLQGTTGSEHADVVANALLLVLRNALGYPCDVANLLRKGLVVMLSKCS